MKKFLLLLLAVALFLPAVAWAEPAAVTLNAASIEIGVGRRATLEATVEPAGAAIQWTSSNAAVAAVNNEGVVLARKPGIAYITARAGGGSARAKVTVYALPTKVTLNKAGATLLEGGKVQLIAKVTPVIARERAVQWSSSDEAVAQVDENGLVTAGAIGAATITARTKNGVKATCKIRVEDKTRYIALTFDDGPNANTLRVLKTLAKYNAHATFFMLGERVRAHPELARQVAEAGHEIGNHSYSHQNYLKLSMAAIRSQISRTDDAIEQAIGRRPVLLRAPGGNITRYIAKAIGRPFVQWSVDPRDWKYRNSDYVYSYVTRFAGNKRIILMHDIHATTASAVERIVPWLAKRGYVFLTVSQLMEMTGGVDPDTMIYRP